MQQIGRKLIFDKASGVILRDAGERAGDVIETTIQEDYPAYDPATMDFIQLAYGERSSEFQNMASMDVDPTTKTLHIYPRIMISVEKPSIASDGVDTATISVTTPAASVDFILNGTTYSRTNQAGVCIFQVSSTLPGNLVIDIQAGKYGSDQITIGVV